MEEWSFLRHITFQEERRHQLYKGDTPRSVLLPPEDLSLARMWTTASWWADRTHKFKLGLSSLLCKQEIRASQRGDRLQNLKPLPPRRQVPSAKNADAILTPWKSQIFIKVRSQVRLLATWSSPNGSLQDGVLHSYRTVPVEGPTLWTQGCTITVPKSNDQNIWASPTQCLGIHWRRPAVLRDTWRT